MAPREGNYDWRNYHEWIKRLPSPESHPDESNCPASFANEPIADSYRGPKIDTRKRRGATSPEQSPELPDLLHQRQSD